MSYILFEWDYGSQMGGWYDYRCCGDTMEKLKQYAEQKKFDNWHIVDMETRKIVAEKTDW